MCISLQVPPTVTTTNVQLEGHMEYMTHGEPVAGVTGPRRPHDHDPADVAYHGMIDYRPLPLRVSNVPVSGTGYLLTDDLDNTVGPSGPIRIPGR